MILFSQKIVNSRSIILCVGKAQGTINGRNRCKLMVGCNLKHCSERY